MSFTLHWILHILWFYELILGYHWARGYVDTMASLYTLVKTNYFWETQIY